MSVQNIAAHKIKKSAIENYFMQRVFFVRSRIDGYDSRYSLFADQSSIGDNRVIMSGGEERISRFRPLRKGLVAKKFTIGSFFSALPQSRLAAMYRCAERAS
jgi:hypothetical protein